MTRLMQALNGLRTVFANEQLRRVELAWGAAIGAEWAHFVALGVFAYQAGGTTAVGIAGLVRMLPAALVAPFAASLGDRVRRERFLAANSLVGALALGGSAAAYFAGGSEAAIFALAALSGVTSTLVRPVHQALLPSIARTPAELIGANGATATIESLGTLAGPLLAGVVVSLTNAGVVFAAAAGALLVAAALVATVHVEGRLQGAAERPGATRGALIEGFRFVARTREPRLVVGLMVAQTFVRGCLNVLIVVAAFRFLHAGAGAVGYLTAAIGLGGLVGAFAALGVEGRRLATTFGLALLLWGIPIAVLAPAPYLPVAVLLLGVVGAANSVEDVFGFTLLQRIVPDAVLARVLGVVWGLAMGALGLGSVAATGLVAAVGPRPAFLVVGALLPALTLLVWRRLAEIDRAAAPPTAGLALIGGLPMFAPLSLAAKEYLATRLVPVRVAARESVIRSGERGDRFYVVGEGRLEVVADGVHESAGRGDHFGEIALLRDVPRTATVRALVDSNLYALEREDFLAAVTGHSRVRAAGEAVVEARLTSRPA